MFDHEGFEEVEKEKFSVPISSLNLPSLVTMDENQTLAEVHHTLHSNKFGAIVLTSNDCLSGILTERDFLLKVWGKYDNWKEVKASEVMTKNPLAMKPTDKVSDCIKIVSRKKFRHLPVVDEQGKPIHMISIKDLLSFIVDFFPKNVSSHGTLIDWEFLQVEDYGENFSFFSKDNDKFSGNIFKTALKRVIDNPPLTVDINKSVDYMIEQMQQRRVGTVLVTEYSTELKGIITERDVLFKIMKDFDSEGKSHVKSISDYMTANPHRLLYKHYLAHAINNMFRYKYRNIIVVDEDKVPLGIVGLLDIFVYIEGYMDL